MLDHVCVLSHSGVVLWERVWVAEPRRAAINELVREVLLEDRAGDESHIVDNKLKLKWVLDNQTGIAVIAVYQKFLQLAHVDRLLAEVKSDFANAFRAVLSSGGGGDAFLATYDSFDDRFATHFDTFTAQERAAKTGAGAAAAVLPAPTSGHGAAAATAATSSPKDTAGACATGPSGSAGAPLPRTGSIQLGGGKVIGRRGAKSTSSGQAASSPTSVSSPISAGGGSKKAKSARDWNKLSGAYVDDAVTAAAASAPVSAEEREAAMLATVEKQKKMLIKRDAEGAAVAVSEKDWGKPKRGFVSTWLRSHFGQRELDEQDFKNMIPKLEEKLITKNVAVDVASLVCKSVETQIAGKKLSTFDSLQQTIEDAMTSALRRILQPKREVNILRDVATAVSRRRPYSIVFCGVNGVGKSTTLSKIAYWLQQNGHSILLAAGDTFRHGAVEQLEVHARCLDVPLLQLGYGTDPSQVAGAALQQAIKTGTHVVLIDTAGRMQDHEPRMRALAKLIHDNTPDLVLFVGEAVVGNNVVDQLRKFNQCLIDFAPANAKPRGIDGLVLTKFDTIDDKVGASVSMVYELGQPIVFVGVGQTYQDLKSIEPETVVAALMS